MGTVSPNEKLVVDGPIRTLPRPSATCDVDHAGSIYFNSVDAAFYGCDGTTWKTLGGGPEVASYKKSCTELFDSGELTSGLYSIDPDGGEPDNAFQVYCEMNIDGGGWTKILQYSGGASLGTVSAVGIGTSWMTSETSAGKLSDSQINAIAGTQLMVATSNTTYGGLRWGIFTPVSMFTWSSASGTYNQIYNWSSTKCWNGGSLDTSTPHEWAVCGDMGGPIGFCTHHSGVWAICLCATGVHENSHPCQTAPAGYNTYNFAVYKRTLPGAGSNTLRKSCQEILAVGESNGSGVYTIDPNGGSPVDGFQVYCDMTTSGGGWTKIMQYYGGTNLAVSGSVGGTNAWVGTETSGGKLSDNQINAIPGTQFMVSTNDSSYGGMKWGVFTPPSMFPWSSASGSYNYIHTWAAASCWNGVSPTTDMPDTWAVCGDMGGPVGFCTHHGGIWAICLCGTGVHENVHPCQTGVSGYSTGFFAVSKR